MTNLYWPELRRRSAKKRGARREARWRKALEAAADVLCVSHGHCLDGVGSALIALHALAPGKPGHYGPSGGGIGVAFAQATEMPDILALVAAEPGRGRRLLISDLSLQKDQYDAIVALCAKAKAGGWKVSWRDHHHKQWEGLDLARLQAHLEVLEVNQDATESGASLQQKALAPDHAWLGSLAATIRDRDLWWNKTPDSETLEFALTEMGTKAFLQTYLEALQTPPASAAPSTLSPVVLPAIQAAADRERAQQDAILGKLLAGSRTWGTGSQKVGIVYGWLPKNTGLHDLLEQGCAIAINVRPNGKMSLRSRKPAAVCHLVAQQFGGGGHPNASGGDLGLKGAAFWWYVLRRGKVAKTEAVAQAAQKALADLAGTQSARA